MIELDPKELERRRVILKQFCTTLGITPDEMQAMHVTLFELVIKFESGELQPRTKYFTEELDND